MPDDDVPDYPENNDDDDVLPPNNPPLVRQNAQVPQPQPATEPDPEEEAPSNRP